MHVRGLGVLAFFAILGFSFSSFAQTAPAAPSAQPSTMFAPYVDMGKPANNLPQLMAASGTKFFTLAFVQSGPGCTPLWQAATTVADDKVFGHYIDRVRSAGGDVIISFGGYDGTDIGQACTDASSLQAAYQSVIDKYKIKIIDLDVEHFAIEDPASIDRRNQALKALVAANPGLQINYTLPASPFGLTDLAVNVLKSAVKYGTPVTIVNLMTMDYGYPVPAGTMGLDSISAVGGAAQQLKSIGLNARIGITPMIGVNDTTTETFSVADAEAVLAYAQANKKVVGLLSFWSAARDSGSCSGTVQPNCSGIVQKDWEFSHVFQKF